MIKLVNENMFVKLTDDSHAHIWYPDDVIGLSHGKPVFARDCFIDGRTVHQGKEVEVVTTATPSDDFLCGEKNASDHRYFISSDREVWKVNRNVWTKATIVDTLTRNIDFSVRDKKFVNIAFPSEMLVVLCPFDSLTVVDLFERTHIITVGSIIGVSFDFAVLSASDNTSTILNVSSIAISTTAGICPVENRFSGNCKATDVSDDSLNHLLESFNGSRLACVLRNSLRLEHENSLDILWTGR